MTTNEMLLNLMKKLGIATKTETETANTTSIEIIPETKLDPSFVSCKFSDLLAEISYYPNGDAPKAHNSLWEVGASKQYWFCSDKKVAFMDAKTGKPVVIADNALERYKTAVAKKWAMERDWIPPYRYTLDDNRAEVGLTLFECLANGVDKANITKKCFEHLDFVYRAKQEDYKTTPKEENANDAERLLYAWLFTGDANTLHRLYNEEGDVLPLPTDADLANIPQSDLKAFEKVAVLFDRTKSRHNAASNETWMSAQCYALGMATKDALEFIYGERAVGKKKHHRCEVAYSRQANQVFGWLLDELKAMQEEGTAEGLEKWAKVLERSEATTWCQKALALAEKYCLVDETAQDFTMVVAVNPLRAKELLTQLLEMAGQANDYDFFAELNGEVVPVAQSVGAEADAEDMPF